MGVMKVQNFNRVSLEFLDEPISGDTQEDINREIESRFAFLQQKVNEQHGKM